jgi:hypothetical protein
MASILALRIVREWASEIIFDGLCIDLSRYATVRQQAGQAGRSNTAPSKSTA